MASRKSGGAVRRTVRSVVDRVRKLVSGRKKSKKGGKLRGSSGGSRR